VVTDLGGGNIAMSVTDLGGGSIARPYPPILRSKNLYHYIIKCHYSRQKKKQEKINK
jgi:hypothetical protein